MRYLLLIVLVGILGLSACTYTKKDGKGREQIISRDEYEMLRE